jgi:hypothetical protein
MRFPASVPAPPVRSGSRLRHAWPLLQSVLLLTLANGTPVVAKKVLVAHLSFPLDAGARFLDGQPLLGPSKTVRGALVSVITTAVVAPLLGLLLYNLHLRDEPY